jgi:SAM-dependent methyltransferase
MTDETPEGEAARELGKAVARALLAFEAAPSTGSVRTKLPHPFSNMTRADWARSIELWREHGAPLLATLHPRGCPSCGASASDYIFDSYDGYPYHECQDCRTWFVPLDVRHEVFERYFTIRPDARRFGDYTDAQAVENAAMDADRARFEGYYSALKSCLGRDAGQAPTTLDVGCGVANSLAVAADHGFAAEGIEVNAHAVNLARGMGRAVNFPGEPTRAERFDAVTMWETLEHISDPLAALQDAHARLLPDGLLALSVPNLNAPDIRSMRGDSLQIHGGPAWPGHINLWTPDTLALLLRRAGFEPLHMSGQFSTNLEELLAYQLGQWSGARDYLRRDAPEFDLPAGASQLVSALGAAASVWQEGFAFAPILCVLARRSDGAAPAGFAAYAAARKMDRNARLHASYDLPVRRPRSVRGRPLDLAQADWASVGAQLCGSRLEIDGRGEAPFAYLWRSADFQEPAASALCVRGVLFEGGISIGLLAGDTWASQVVVTTDGPFEVSLDMPAGMTVRLLVCNNDMGRGGGVADIDCASVSSAGWGLP